MKRHKLVGAILCIVLASGGYLMLRNRNIQEQPMPDLLSRSGTSPAEFMNAQKAVGYYRDRIALEPGVVKNYVELAQLYLQEARVTGNHHMYVPKARHLLEEALEREPHNVGAMITNASVLMTMHQFSDAKNIAESIVEKSPYSAFSYGVLCDAQVELGEYENAVRTCDRMLSVRPDLRSYARASYLRELHGDLAGAKKAMQLAGESGIQGHEDRAWAFFNLGKLFINEGQLDTAAFIFNGILQERPNYAYALSGLAQISRARGEYEDAIRLLTRASEITPEHIFLEQLADIYRATGNKESARATAELVLKSFEQHEKEGWNIDKEYAIFCANHELHLTEALQRAEREYGRRPDNIETLEAYAWVLFKSGRAPEAVGFIERALRLHSQNAILMHHAAMIYDAAGQKEKADSARKKLPTTTL